MSGIQRFLGWITTLSTPPYSLVFQDNWKINKQCIVNKWLDNKHPDWIQEAVLAYCPFDGFSIICMMDAHGSGKRAKLCSRHNVQWERWCPHLVVSPHEVEPHAGGQQLVLLVLEIVTDLILIPRMKGALKVCTKSTICCKVTPKVMTMGEDSLRTGLFWTL